MTLPRHQSHDGRAVLVESGWTYNERLICRTDNTLAGRIVRSADGGIVYTVRDLSGDIVAQERTVWQAIHAAIEKWGVAE